MVADRGRIQNVSQPQLSETVASLLRDRIMSGQLRPGERIRLEEVAQETGLSITPVREALRRLIAEGMVTMGENRRCHVTQFTASEIQSVYEIRARLESYAAERACSRITPDGASLLRQINGRIAELGPVISRDNINSFLELNLEFHMAILNMADSRQLDSALKNALTMPIVLLKHYVWSDNVRLSLSHSQHEEIILALESGNRAWAGACMANHIQTSRPITVLPEA